MEFLIFLLIIASAVARSKKDKDKKSARQREQERRRKIQSAWEEATKGSDQSADPWGEAWSSQPKQAEQTHMGSYVPSEAEPAPAPMQPKPLQRPSMEKQSAYTPVTTTGPAPTVLEKAKKAAVSAMKELNNTVKGSMDFDSAEGESSKEGKSRYTAKHVVQPFTEGSHRHTESSITGTEPCPTEVDVYTPPKAAEPAAAGSFLGSITGDELRRAVIYSEILGKPKGRR